MSSWRRSVNRLLSFFGRPRETRHATTTSWTRRYVRWAAPLLVLFLLVGCGRGLRHESWPGLIVENGTVYAADLAAVQAMDAETGKVYWSFPAEASREARAFYAAPVLAEDYGDYGMLLVAGFQDQTVYGLALGESPAERPDELWSFSEAGGQYVSTGVVAGGLFIIGNGDGHVYALNVADGTQAWEFVTGDRVWTTPLVVNDTVYVASLDHHLYALDVATGEALWDVETAGAVATSPVYAGGDVWIGDFTSTLYRIDPETQSVVWTYEAQDWLWATPLLDGDILYFADVGGHVYALNVTTDEFVWDDPATIDDVIHGQPALSQDGSLLFVAGYEKGLVHAIDTTTGKVLESWADAPENPGRLPGDLVADGERVYAMPILVQERVQAYNLATGELVWSAPDVAE